MIPVALLLRGKAIVAFFSTTLGQIIGIGLLGLALYVVGDWRGSAREREACDARVTKMIDDGKTAAEARDARIRAESKKDADARIASIAAMRDDLQKKAATYETELAKLKGRRNCIAGPVDERGMRGL